MVAPIKIILCYRYIDIQCLTHNLCDLHEAGFRTLNISKEKS